MENQWLEKSSHSPLYQQLMTRLKNDIIAGVYPSGARIPSEQTLCDTYGVSRVTVRKALLDLVREGMLIRKQGKGTFVAEEKLQRNLQSITSFTNACKSLGHEAGAKLVHVLHEAPTAEDQARLHLTDGEDIIEICRIRLCDGEAVMLEINRYPSRYAFLETCDATTSQYDLLKQSGIIPSGATHDISLGHATPFVSKYLFPAQEGDALLMLDELVRDQHGHPLHVSRQWIRGDRFTFRI